MKYDHECANKQSFCEWFDVDHIGHIRAYEQLQKTGMWPVGFVGNMYLEPNWQMILAFKLANKWVDYMLEEEEKYE